MTTLSSITYFNCCNYLTGNIKLLNVAYSQKLFHLGLKSPKNVSNPFPYLHPPKEKIG